MTPRRTAAILLVFVGCSAGASTPPGGAGTSSANDGGSGNPSGDGAPGTLDAGRGTDGGGNDTWTDYASGFFKSYCTECHNPQDSTGRDFNVQAKVEAEKSIVRCGVAVTQDPSWSCAPSPVAKQFPIGSGPKPSDAERARIVAWISAGTP
jgi:hypothetical protein